MTGKSSLRLKRGGSSSEKIRRGRQTIGMREPEERTTEEREGEDAILKKRHQKAIKHYSQRESAQRVTRKSTDEPSKHNVA